MLFDDGNSFENWAETLPRQDSHERHGCACCSALPSLLADQVDDVEQLTQSEHWAARGPAPSEVVDGLWINAKIYTMDQSQRVVDALAIRNGKVLACGHAADLIKAHGDTLQVIDAKGRTILPGFIEPHMHFLPIATIGRLEDVGPYRFSKTADALAHLKSLAATLAPGEWLMGRQFDPSLQTGPDQLTLKELDAVSAVNPVFIYNASLHFAYCNAAALAVAGITKATPDDPASPYGRDALGAPNGVLKGNRAIGSVARHNPAQREYDLAEAALEVCTRANRKGITTFCDQATGMVRGTSEVDIYEALAKSGRMTARLRYSLSYGLAEKWDASDIRYGHGDAQVRAVGWKIVSDGSNQGFSGLQREPYLYKEDTGLAYVAPAVLTEMVRSRTELGWPLVIHANGDLAIDRALDAFEAVVDSGLALNAPCRIEHCSILHDEQIQRIKALGLSPSFLIGHVYYWGHAMRDQVFGEAKAVLLDRTKACEDAGIRWTLHSDEPVTEMGPLRCIENAVTRSLWKEPGQQLAPWEAVSVMAGLRAMTIDAAWQCHSDHEIGSLEPGKWADFVILEQDPMSCPIDAISDIAVLETWLSGRLVFDQSADSAGGALDGLAEVES
ncbi:MAG: amidohydrolase [Gammaproteobacteria bacterium]|jgi:predicted amidohydrolase YtcJ|nr:amidohydrolase [Gammaproteobacteria bacterium]